MDTYVTKTKVTKDGKIAIKLPFRPGQYVEVIVRNLPKKERANPYPLRGLPYRYEKPFESVAENDWEALK
jgi:NAD(P)H-flavin reductase